MVNEHDVSKITYLRLISLLRSCAASYLTQTLGLLQFISYPNTWAALHSTVHLPDMFVPSLPPSDVEGGTKTILCCYIEN